jgi:hypothetical protein
MDMNSEKRINEVMKSLDGIQRAEAGPFLYTRIQSRIKDSVAEYTPARLIWLAAASLALLFVLNFSAIRHAVSGSENTSIESIASGYNLMNENSINYN